jgi:hypothetical protein
VTQSSNHKHFIVFFWNFDLFVFSSIPSSSASAAASAAATGYNPHTTNIAVGSYLQLQSFLSFLFYFFLFFTG